MPARYARADLPTRFTRRDLYRPAALSWMMPLADILSTIENVLLSAALASAVLPLSIAARMLFSAVRSRERSSRLCAVRLMVWRCAFIAEACRVATTWSSLVQHGLSG